VTQRSCRACGSWHDLDEPWPAECAGHFQLNYKRSSLAAPMLIKDGMDAVQSQLTGQWYESKSSLRKEYKAHNVIEIGSDAPKAPKPVESVKVTTEEIGRALQKVKQGYKPSIHSEPTTAGHSGFEFH
jgi:hypothetical protein